LTIYTNYQFYTVHSQRSLFNDTQRNWLVVIEAVVSAGPVDRKRRAELKELFRGCPAGLVFVTAFLSRDATRSFLAQISWETEVWVAENPDHLIHFNGERFLGPYPDVLPLETSAARPLPTKRAK
jgi:type II restriction enzyme